MAGKYYWYYLSFFPGVITMQTRSSVRLVVDLYRGELPAGMVHPAGYTP